MGNTAAFKHHPKLKDYVSWFEIPAYDITRATTFYNAIYNMEMEHAQNGDFFMAYFPADKGIGGALIQGPGCYPNDTGVLIYLNAGNDIDSILGRIELAGGRIIMPKTLISDTSGNFALFIDSEGNRLALHEGPTRVGRALNSAKAEKAPVQKPAPSAKAAVSKSKKKAVAKKTAKKGR
jgi:predicted enzyme related to lactoylglutathione lyase